MANKRAKNKELQSYNPKPVPNFCSNCKHFKMEIEEVSGYFGPYKKERNLRCALPGMGGFAIKKQGICKFHDRSEDVGNGKHL